jgi:uncharacterized protein YkwD
MKKTGKTVVFVILAVMLLISSFSCAAGVSQAEYDSLKKQLAEAETQLNVLKGSAVTPAGEVPGATVEALQNQNEINAGKIKALETANTAIAAEKAALEVKSGELSADLEELDAKYLEIKKQYDVLTRPAAPAVLDPKAVEQAIFNALNRDRISAGVPVLLWGYNLYPLAQQNSRKMAEFGKFEYSQWGTVQYIYIAAGYHTVESVVNGATLTWKSNKFNFDNTILRSLNTHCAIGVEKVGEVFYITLLAADYP